ncbi:MAG: sporulation protein YqfC [Clostridiaceae bacterium]|nr:sporulation protein YqfC [Clostridiaceae bacterium]
MQDSNAKKTEKQGQKGNRVGGGFLEKLINILELPQEVMLGTPKMVLTGNNRLLVENCRGIVEFEKQKIRLSTLDGFVKIQGEYLSIKEISRENVIIIGEINSLEFVK